MDKPETIGLLAGSGQFPFLVARGARQAGLAVAAVGFQDNADPALAQEVDVWCELNLGQLGKLIAFLKDNRVTRTCLAGAIAKPRALDIRPDMRAMKLLFKTKTRGDTAILRAVADELESEGIRVVQPSDLAPGLLAPGGVLTRRGPTDEEWDDLRHGWSVAKRVGALDIGQCVVVRKGMVAAVEALEGTDAAIRRGAELGGAGCVVVKIVKPGQDERIDLPALGLDTIRVLAETGCSCLGFEAGKTLFFDREEALALANDKGLAVVGLTPTDSGKQDS